VHRRKLGAVWAQTLAASPDGQRTPPLVVDVAAGAGFALRAAYHALKGRGRFFAVDYSAAAVATATGGREAFLGFAADASVLPLAHQCADLVISQFGIEYAGERAFADAARILAPAGRFCSISHLAGGAIEQECAENERLLFGVQKLAVIQAARTTLAASYTRQPKSDPQPIDRAKEAAFEAALAEARSMVRVAQPLAARATVERFLQDLRRLCTRRFAFAPDEAIAWLDGMDASLSAYLKRMQSMRASALDRQKIEAIASQFFGSGLAGFDARTLSLDESKPPAAWLITAFRPA
jgi:SAM-dependent methyltransferase